MTFYFGALTALCAAYWVLLLMYSGFLVQQHWIWLFFAAFFLLNAAAAWGYRRGLRTTPLWLVTALHTTAFAGLAVMIAAGILIATGMTREEVRNPEFCIVLGASVREDGSLSPSLKRRLDETIRFSDRNPVTRFVLSGGQGPREPVTEAEAMGSYLVYNGVPEDRLLLEIQSKNTYENILYSDALISRILEEEKKGRSRAAKKAPEGSSFIQAEGLPVRVAILSADYHLFRALHMAEKMTGGEYCGIAAKSDPVMFAHFVTRECIAIVKDKFFGRL